MFKDYMSQKFVGFCVVRKASIAKTTAGKPYANLQVYDGTEQIMGRIWDYEGPLPEENTVVKVDGTISEYNGSPQITINRWRPAEDGEYSPSEFLPAYQGDRDILVNELLQQINDQIKLSSLRTLVHELVMVFKQEYYNAPAAVTYHHNYLGGLLEHTVSVTKLAIFLADNQKQPINRDLVVAGAILHDIGKIQAYNWSGCAIELSSDGIMLDHIPLGLMMLKPYTDKYLTGEVAQQLFHILVSHHGTKEWGSSVEPKTQEALIVHLADLVDARLNNK